MLRLAFAVNAMLDLSILSKGAFHLSELAGRTIAGPVILTMKVAFSDGFAEKPFPSSTLFRILPIWLESFD